MSVVLTPKHTNKRGAKQDFVSLGTIKCKCLECMHIFKYQLVFGECCWSGLACVNDCFYVHGLLSVQECICAYTCKCVWGGADHETCYFKRFHCTALVLLSPIPTLKFPMTTHLYRLTPSSVGFSVNNSLAATTFKVSTGCTAIFVTVKVSSAQMHAVI